MGMRNEAAGTALPAKGGTDDPVASPPHLFHWTESASGASLFAVTPVMIRDARSGIWTARPIGLAKPGRAPALAAFPPEVAKILHI